MHFLVNRKLALSISINVFLTVILSILFYLAYPQLIYQLESVDNLWGQYSVRTYRKDYGLAYFEVLRGHKRIYSYSGKERFFVVILGTDVTGNGMPNLIVSQYLGGAHGNSRYIVLELDGSVVNEIDVIDGLDAEFRDLNHDGICEIRGIDRSYDYFLGDSFAASPRPLVVLSFEKNQAKFVLDKKLMSKSPFSREQFYELSLKYREDTRWFKEFRPPSELFDTMLKLIYSGNEKQAWELFDASWNNAPSISKEQYKENIEEELKHSPFYPIIAN